MKNQLKTILLLGALSALLVAFGASLGPGWMWGMTLVALATVSYTHLTLPTILLV